MALFREGSGMVRKVFSVGSSGQKRLDELFRMNPDVRIDRITVQTVAAQEDSAERVRDARTALREDGMLILGYRGRPGGSPRRRGPPLRGRGVDRGEGPSHRGGLRFTGLLDRRQGLPEGEGRRGPPAGSGDAAGEGVTAGRALSTGCGQGGAGAGEGVSGRGVGLFR
ncbi:NaeI family type II restriction endonuclease [Kitasatospora phosalacinea]|uniref:NaeI family type II restriction endonuclease n=1 Tax=Kitasatospora phosalacinea TaxID=2065 RepID=UPI0035DB654E